MSHRGSLGQIDETWILEINISILWIHLIGWDGLHKTNVPSDEPQPSQGMSVLGGVSCGLWGFEMEWDIDTAIIKY